MSPEAAGRFSIDDAIRGLRGQAGPATGLDRAVARFEAPVASFGSYVDRFGDAISALSGRSAPEGPDVAPVAAPEALPQFAKGTDYVPHDMVAVVHRGEKITPAREAAQERQRPEKVPSFAEGTPFVPRDTFAFLHQGERVTPAAANAPGGASAPGSSQFDRSVTTFASAVSTFASASRGQGGEPPPTARGAAPPSRGQADQSVTLDQLQASLGQQQERAAQTLDTLKAGGAVSRRDLSQASAAVTQQRQLTDLGLMPGAGRPPAFARSAPGDALLGGEGSGGDRTLPFPAAVSERWQAAASATADLERARTSGDAASIAGAKGLLGPSPASPGGGFQQPSFAPIGGYDIPRSRNFADSSRERHALTAPPGGGGQREQGAVNARAQLINEGDAPGRRGRKVTPQAEEDPVSRVIANMNNASRARIQARQSLGVRPSDATSFVTAAPAPRSFSNEQQITNQMALEGKMVAGDLFGAPQAGPPAPVAAPLRGEGTRPASIGITRDLGGLPGEPGTETPRFFTREAPPMRARPDEGFGPSPLTPPAPGQGLQFGPQPEGGGPAGGQAPEGRRGKSAADVLADEVVAGAARIKQSLSQGGGDGGGGGGGGEDDSAAIQKIQSTVRGMMDEIERHITKSLSRDRAATVGWGR